MGGQKSKENVSTSLTRINAITTVPSGAIRPRQRIVQNFLLIWVDASINESSKICQDALTQLRSVVNDVNIFTEPDQCVHFLNELQDEKAFVIVSESLGEHLIPNIHALTQLDTIYIFCENEVRHKNWPKEWVKIKGIHTDIKPIYQALQQATKQCNQDSIPVSFFTVNKRASSQNLDQLDPSFMYTKIFNEILLEMEHDEESIKNLAIYCRQFYKDNMNELTIIGEFEHNYQSNSAIWWYTRECFTYQMLNRALRTLEADTIINMGFFIRDLQEQIQELYEKQVNTYRGVPFTVYRGQGLLKTDFEKLVKTKGGLMSFNNFLSTSTTPEDSLVIAENALTNTDKMGILFTMTIDPFVSSAPFASIREVSYYDEEEILFSMHTVFRIVEINQIDNNDSFYQVDLKLAANNDQQLRILTERIRKEAVGKTGWKRLGQLLLKLSQFGKAEELYNVLLEQTLDQGDKVIYYNQLGYIKGQQDDYQKAIEYYEKALEIKQKTLRPNYPDLAISYNNIGLMYTSMGEYENALSFYEKALEIRQETLPPNHPSLANSYNIIGEVYDKMGEYSKALSFLQKDIEIRQKALPPNHHSLAISYNNIGSVFNNMGEYSKALSFYKKDLEISQKILPANHPHLSTSYNNIGLMYDNMGEYSNALRFYEIALEIDQKTLPPNHPDLAISYNNIGGVYDNIGDYSKALSFYEKDLEISQKNLPANHPDLAISCNNIGLVYDNTGEYENALLFYEKALEIYRETLPADHSLLATSYNNIGGVYYNTREYSKALAYFERALDIKQRSLPSNHPSIQSVRESIEIVKRKL